MISSLYGNPAYTSGKHLMFECLFRSGLVHLSRRHNRHSALVLIYHDVLPAGFPQDNALFGMSVSTTEFEWQIQYLRRHYNPINFQQFADWFHGNTELPDCPVLITFDDGHANNFEFALPILSKFEISPVCFVVTESLGTRKQTWFEDAYYRLMFSPALTWKTQTGEVWPLGTQQQRTAACGRFFTLCRSFTRTQQQTELDCMRADLPVSVSDDYYRARFEFLSAAQLRRMREAGVEIGAHTVTHPILSTLSPDSAHRELSLSKSQLENIIGSPVRAFAYPFGAPGLDFGARETTLAAQSGFSFAFAGEGGLVNPSSDALSIPRVGIGRMTRAQFAASITGATDALKSLLSKAA